MTTRDQDMKEAIQLFRDYCFFHKKNMLTHASVKLNSLNDLGYFVRELEHSWRLLDIRDFTEKAAIRKFQ